MKIVLILSCQPYSPQFSDWPLLQHPVLQPDYVIPDVKEQYSLTLCLYVWCFAIMCVAKTGESVLSIVRDLFYWCAYLWVLRNLQIEDASEISQVTFHNSGFKWIQKTWPVLCCRLETPELCSDLCSSWIYFFPVYFWVVLWTTCVYPLPVSCFSICSLCSETLPAHPQWLSVQLPVRLLLSPFFLLLFKPESVLLYFFLHSS